MVVVVVVDDLAVRVSSSCTAALLSWTADAIAAVTAPGGWPALAGRRTYGLVVVEVEMVAVFVVVVVVVGVQGTVSLFDQYNSNAPATSACCFLRIVKKDKRKKESMSSSVFSGGIGCKRWLITSPKINSATRHSKTHWRCYSGVYISYNTKNYSDAILLNKIYYKNATTSNNSQNNGYAVPCMQYI